MISDIIYSKGKDNFKDDTFSAREGSNLVLGSNDTMDIYGF